MSRTVILTSGGDWADASVVAVELKSEKSLKELHAEWRSWYENEYLPVLRYSPIKYLDFGPWLIERGIAKKSNIEFFHVD